MAGETSRTVRYFPESGDYLTFVEEFLLPNQPCLFPETTTRNWRARQEWQKDGKPNIEYLAAQFGDAVVPVADCAREDFNSHCKIEMQLSDYLKYWRKIHRQTHTDQASEETDEKEPLLYLKDWHFVKQYPEYGAYTILPYFTADWLNEAWDNRRDVADDYRFVYFGPKGTWTPFHADVFRSYSWSANVCGRKEWLLFPPGEENQLRDRRGRLPFDLRRSESCDRAIRVVQEAGEVMFVPSCWYHQVHNLEDTLSINHNWTNGFGVMRMWQHLQSELVQVKKELSDCSDMSGWHQHCQVVLRACVGMDYRELLEMLCLLAKPRLTELKQFLPALISLPPSLSPIHQTLAANDSPSVFSKTSNDGTVTDDNLVSILSTCSSSRLQILEEQHLSGDVCELLASMEDDDDDSRTFCLLRLFELQQIATVLSQLSVNPDLSLKPS